MVNHPSIISQDLKHIWHPCMQMKDFEKSPPLIVNDANGVYLETNLGRIIDGQSSWWCKSLGHKHPAVIKAIQDQLQKFEHVIAANTTHDRLAQFGEVLSSLIELPHVCFASDGSCAVEIALKLALFAQRYRGHPNRQHFIALKNAYHGETMGTLTVSDLGIYKKGTPTINRKCNFLNNIPYVTDTNDPLWENCASIWPNIESQLRPWANDCAAIILEPIIQGAGGMRVYSADFLKRLVAWAKDHRIYVIADEIMTGIGRSGTWLAMEHSRAQADMVCLSKGLTAGAIPLSCTAVSQDIYDVFYCDYEEGRSFLHSHTHSANALGISAALATLSTTRPIIENGQINKLQESMRSAMHDVARNTKKLTNVRGIGGMVAADITSVTQTRAGFHFFQEALKKGALLRPLGNTIYWLPPLNTKLDVIEALANITEQSLSTL